MAVKDIHRSARLDCFIGRKVKITFYDGSCAIGTLGYSAEWNPVDPQKTHMYFVQRMFGSVFFRKSHVKKIEVEMYE